MTTDTRHIEIENGIKRAHELRSEAFFDLLEALTSPFKATETRHRR